MDALHVPNIAGPWGLMPGPATRVVHLINNKGPWGESTCICGRSVTEKFNTYPALAPGQRDFRELVRVCVHCGEEKFLVPRYAF